MLPPTLSAERQLDYSRGQSQPEMGGTRISFRMLWGGRGAAWTPHELTLCFFGRFLCRVSANQATVEQLADKHASKSHFPRASSESRDIVRQGVSLPAMWPVLNR